MCTVSDDQPPPPVQSHCVTRGFWIMVQPWTTYLFAFLPESDTVWWLTCFYFDKLTKLTLLFPFFTKNRWYDSRKRACSVVSKSIDICWLCTSLSSSCPFMSQSASSMIHSSIYLYWWWTQAVLFISLSKIYSVPFGRPFFSVCLRDTVHCQHIV